MARSRIQLARQNITKHFDRLSQKIFKPTDLTAIFSEQRTPWNLARSTRNGDFIDFLLDHGKLKSFPFPFPYRREHRYAWGNVSFLEVLMSLKKDSYFCHGTAATMLSLTNDHPGVMYINYEQPAHVANRDLEQDRIDAAFSRAPRKSNNIVEHDGIQICLVNGMWTDQLGVIEQKVQYEPFGKGHVRLTNLERTLVDLVVRPAYAGGVKAVLKAFEQAKDRLSVANLVAVLHKLNYVYPYHQAIGFYLDRAGCKPSALAALQKLPMEFDFYLAHDMGKTEYIDKWRLYVPKGF